MMMQSKYWLMKNIIHGYYQNYSHESFRKFMTDLEIYIDGFNNKGIPIANAFLDVMRYKLNELGADSTDVFTKIFGTSHIETE